MLEITNWTCTIWTYLVYNLDMSSGEFPGAKSERYMHIWSKNFSQAKMAELTSIFNSDIARYS